MAEEPKRHSQTCEAAQPNFERDLHVRKGMKPARGSPARPPGASIWLPRVGPGRLDGQASSRASMRKATILRASERDRERGSEGGREGREKERAILKVEIYKLQK